MARHKTESMTAQLGLQFTQVASHNYLPDSQAGVHRNCVHADGDQHVLLTGQLAGRVAAKGHHVVCGRDGGTLPGLYWGSRRLGLREVIQNEPDDGHGVTVDVVRQNDGILLKTDLPQAVEQMAVHCLRWLIRIIWLLRLEVVDTLIQGGVGEPRKDQTQPVGLRDFLRYRL